MVTLSLSYGAKSQTTDTICLPMAQAQKLLTAAKQRDVLQEKINLMGSDVTILNNRITELQGAISDFKAKDDGFNQIVNTYTSEIQIMQEQRAILEKQITDLNSEIKKLKRKNFWTSVGGIAAVIGIIYLTK